MGRPPERSDDDRSGWGSGPAPRGWRPESRPVRVARTVRDMFTRGPRRRPATGAPENNAAPGAPVQATPAWLNSPPPPHMTVAGMERGAATPRSAGGPSASGSRWVGPSPRDSRDSRDSRDQKGRDAPGGERARGPFAPPDRSAASSRGASAYDEGGKGAPLAHDPNVAPPRWHQPDWLPPTPPSAGPPRGPLGDPDFLDPGDGGGYTGGYSDFDPPFGASGEYAGYAPYSGAPQPYSQNAQNTCHP